jgi:hypothetical protein
MGLKKWTLIKEKLAHGCRPSALQRQQTKLLVKKTPLR